jgi:hypothetical protein
VGAPDTECRIRDGAPVGSGGPRSPRYGRDPRLHERRRTAGWKLRAYLRRWKFEVGAFFDGAGPDSSDEDLRRVGPGHPVFRIATPTGG